MLYDKEVQKERNFKTKYKSIIGRGELLYVPADETKWTKETYLSIISLKLNCSYENIEYELQDCCKAKLIDILSDITNGVLKVNE